MREWLERKTHKKEKKRKMDFISVFRKGLLCMEIISLKHIPELKINSSICKTGGVESKSLTGESDWKDCQAGFAEGTGPLWPLYQWLCTLLQQRFILYETSCHNHILLCQRPHHKTGSAYLLTPLFFSLAEKKI